MADAIAAKVDYLNTEEFKNTIEAFRKGCERYKNIKISVQKTTQSLLNHWEGEGAIQFEKDYNLIYRQLDDISDLLYELYNGLIDAEAEFISADQALAKQFTV